MYALSGISSFTKQLQAFRMVLQGKSSICSSKRREGAEARRKIKHLLNGEWKPTAGGLSVFSFSPKAPWMSEMFLELEGVLTFSATKCSCKVFLH